MPGRGFAGIVERPPDKPLMAAVEGYAVAGGFEIALACDVMVAARDASSACPRSGAGWSPPVAVCCACRIGCHTAWRSSGRSPGGSSRHPGSRSRARQPADRARGRPGRRAGSRTAIAANGPLAVRATKRILVESREWPAAEAFDRQREISEPVRASADAQEGARAFAEKRRPQWRGA